MKKHISILIMIMILSAVVLFAQGQSDKEEGIDEKIKSLKQIIEATEKLPEEEVTEELKKSIHEIKKLLKLYESDIPAMSLMSVKGVYVRIDLQLRDERSKNLGLEEQVIRAKVELKLRLAGINVFSQGECYKEPDTPILYISTLCVKYSNEGLYAINTGIQFKQTVDAKRPIYMPIVEAITWERSILSVNVRTSKEIYDNIENLTEIFINAYLMANPKE